MNTQAVLSRLIRRLAQRLPHQHRCRRLVARWRSADGSCTHIQVPRTCKKCRLTILIGSLKPWTRQTSLRGAARTAASALRSRARGNRAPPQLHSAPQHVNCFAASCFLPQDAASAVVQGGTLRDRKNC